MPEPTAPSAPDPEPREADLFADVPSTVPRGVCEDPPDAGHHHESEGGA
jgi:hypothetical protein